MRYVRIGLLVGLLGLSAACGSDSGDGDMGDPSGDGNNGGGAQVGETKSAMITAADGGELALGASALAVPPGALPEDLEISVKVEARAGKPDADNILLDIYDFGPDGTTFTKPVELAFDMAGVEQREGGTIKVAWLNGDKWEAVPTTIEGGKAVGQIMHFTPFTLVFVLDGEGGGQQVGGQCGDEFEPCGGDITGTWEYSAACATVNPNGSDEQGDDPFQSCTEKPRFSATIDVSGDVTFGADGSFSTNQTATFSGSFFIPESCFEQLSMGQPVTCEDIDEGFATVQGGCEQAFAEDPEMDQSSGTYEAEGNTLTLTKTDEATSMPGEPSAAEYCVKGDTLEVRVVEEEGTFIYTATRK